MLHPKLRTLVKKIRDKSLQEKVIELLENPTIEIGGKKYSGVPLEVSPAGLSHHHCYPGGFIEHIVSTGAVALAMCDSVEKIYHGQVNRDLVIAGVLLLYALKALGCIAKVFSSDRE